MTAIITNFSDLINQTITNFFRIKNFNLVQCPGDDVFSRQVAPPLSSALVRFTSEFGMDRVVPHRSSHQDTTLNLPAMPHSVWAAGMCYLFPNMLKGRVRESFELFVQISLRLYSPSTVCRSTWCSSRVLITNSHLRVSFPLRCFQRLSLRNVATRRCH